MLQEKKSKRGTWIALGCVAALLVLVMVLENTMQPTSMLFTVLKKGAVYALVAASLNLLNGFYVNLEYPLPNGGTVKLLNDADIYWGNQIERPGNDRCYGIVGDDRHLLVCEYGCNGSDPEILVYQKRGLRTP